MAWRTVALATPCCLMSSFSLGTRLFGVNSPRRMRLRISAAICW
ncbi:hypothetical protein FHS22_005020 [Planomonospora venezuelensis]|uniref:Uncharacterized protein n=1 Tax=Planomonospora venezuelensis TaxID=1999 RepID=A0A841D743_PLAVE|nr:hypothetical protein [Planomonospora venezuelensis]